MAVAEGRLIPVPGGRAQRPTLEQRLAAAAWLVVTTLLFVDIAGSTERIVTMGDATWRELLHRHYTVTRRAISVFDGTEVDVAGDGLLATFNGPARAIRCARSIQREAVPLGLALRAGVHTAEVERVDNTVRGIAVHTAARIAALASPGEVLVSCPFHLLHPVPSVYPIQMFGGRAAVRQEHRALIPRDTQRALPWTVWSFRRNAEEDRGEPH